MSEKPLKTNDMSGPSADDAVDEAINKRLTQRLMDNAIKERPQSAPAYNVLPNRHQARSFRHLFTQGLALVGIAGLMVILFLMSVFERKEKTL